MKNPNAAEAPDGSRFLPIDQAPWRIRRDHYRRERRNNVIAIFVIVIFIVIVVVFLRWCLTRVV